ncbi:MAG: hypothetical protein ACRC1K_08355 [Planctomycetia bacterium]
MQPFPLQNLRGVGGAAEEAGGTPAPQAEEAGGTPAAQAEEAGGTPAAQAELG